MKNFRLLFLLMALIALGITGCKDDDDDDKPNPTNTDTYTLENMAARWQASNGLFYELAADGKAVVGQYSEIMDQDDIMDNNANWEIKTILWDDFDLVSGQIIEKSGDGIVVTDKDGYTELEIRHSDTIYDHLNSMTFLRQSVNGGGGDGIDPVSDVKVVQLDDGLVWLTWTNPSDYNSIEIFNGEMVEGSTANRVGLVEGDGDNDYKVTGLENGTEYTFYVYASKFGAGHSEPAIITATPEDEGLCLEEEDLSGTFWEYNTYSTHKRIEFINVGTVKYFENYGVANQTETFWTFTGYEGSMYYTGTFYEGGIELGEFKISVYDLTFNDNTYKRVAQ